MPSSDLPPREPSQRLAERSRQKRQLEEVDKEKDGGRKKSGRNANQGLSRRTPADLYPGLNDLSDGLEAIPMDVIRHFTLLKEIDAKCVGTTPLLGELIGEFLSLPVPSPATLQAALAASTGETPGQQPNGDGIEPAPAVSEEEISSIVKREELLAQIRRLINELVPCLEEKMHVAGVAADAMARHVARIDYDFDLIVRNEIPQRVQLGPSNHPAFIAETRLANEQQKGAQTSRSESRREAMAAKKAAAAANDGNSSSSSITNNAILGGTAAGSGKGRHSTPTAKVPNTTTSAGRGRGSGKASALGVSVNTSSLSGNGNTQSNPPGPKRRKANTGANININAMNSSGNNDNNSDYNNYNNNNNNNNSNNNNNNYNSNTSNTGNTGNNNPTNPNTNTNLNNPNTATSNTTTTTSNPTYTYYETHNPTISTENANFNDNSFEYQENTTYEEISRPGTPAGRRVGRQRTRTVGNNTTSSSKDEGEPVYCYCQQVSYGEMVGCDGPECKREWFHLPCIGLEAPPKGQWFCDECAVKYKKRNNSDKR